MHANTSASVQLTLHPASWGIEPASKRHPCILAYLRRRVFDHPNSQSPKNENATNSICTV